MKSKEKQPNIHAHRHKNPKIQKLYQKYTMHRIGADKQSKTKSAKRKLKLGRDDKGKKVEEWRTSIAVTKGWRILRSQFILSIILNCREAIPMVAETLGDGGDGRMRRRLESERATKNRRVHVVQLQFGVSEENGTRSTNWKGSGETNGGGGRTQKRTKKLVGRVT